MFSTAKFVEVYLSSMFLSNTEMTQQDDILYTRCGFRFMLGYSSMLLDGVFYLLCISNGDMPAYQLALQAGARLGYDDTSNVFSIDC